MKENPFFPEIHGNFGFGCMRLPMNGEEVDLPQFTRMVDEFLAAGFNYFDTATVYIGGKSETALREALTKRYPRDRFVFTNKLSGPLFEKEEDIRPLVERQLESCGLDYFDFYLMHSQHAGNYEKYKACKAYETAFQLKAEGKLRHVGISFHDTTRCWTGSSPSSPAWRWSSSSSTTWTTRMSGSRAGSATKSVRSMASRCWSWSQ